MRRPFRFAKLTHTLSAALAPLFLFTTPTFANCVNPGGTGGCFSSIQAAVDAAAVGETVNIAAGTYFENVLVTTEGIALVGAGLSTVLDPDTPNSDHGITVVANNVTIKNLLIRNGVLAGISVSSGVTGTRISRVTIWGPEENCIAISGDDTVVERSSLRGCGDDGIFVEASDVHILKNTLAECDDECIEAEGEMLEISGNTVSPCGSGCIDVTGVDITIEKNKISAADGEGIRVFGDNLSVQKNSVKATDDGGIDVNCAPFSCDSDPTRTIFAGGPGTSACQQFNGDQTSCEAAWHIGDNGPASCYYDGANCRGCGPNNENNGFCTNTCTGSSCAGIVAGNSVTDTSDNECFDLNSSGPGLVVEKNKAKRCEEEAFDISGTGIVLRNNQALDSGTESDDDGFDISGQDHVLEKNSAKRNRDDGFRITGTGHTLTGNTANENGEDGFDVGGDGDGAETVTLTENTAENNNAVGIEVSFDAIDTTVTDNTASGNRTDFCDEGTNTTTSGNAFGTTGSCVID